MDSFLYVARSFLARGSEKDIDSALKVISIYQEKRKQNIYVDSVVLAIALSNGKRKLPNDDEYNAVLKSIKNKSQDSEYYSVPHDRKICGLVLDHIGAVYARMGEYASDIYIQTYKFHDYIVL